MTEAICLASGGLLKEVHDLRFGQPGNIRGLFLAGDYTRLPSLNGALKSGVDAAEAGLSHATPTGA